MFAVADNHKPGYSNQGRMFHCGRAIYRALLIIAPGMGAVQETYQYIKRHSVVFLIYVQ